MKSHVLFGIGCVSSVLCCSAATADFQGLDYTLTATGAAGADTWTVDVYAVMDQGERLDAVAGDAKNNKTVTTSGTFFQSQYGGPTSQSINPIFFPQAPSLEFDSWVTIGARDMNNNNLNDIGIDWTDFEAGGDLWTDNGTWFVTPKDAQGEAIEFTNQNCESKWGVLVAQLTVNGLSESIYMHAKFQGKDVNGDTWSDTANITIYYPQIIDCNNNGVDDACDIANGTSTDMNADGIPDECEFPDCNSNGVDDNDDIANGTSEDCNANDVPDECELDGNDCNSNGILDECEMFADCNENGIPDECETFNDCNENGIPDECEVLQDWNGNGVPDDCEDFWAYNVTTGGTYLHLDTAIIESEDGDIIWVYGEYADLLDEVDFHGRAIELEAFGNLFSFTAEVQLADGASFKTGDYTDMAGLRSGTSGTATLTSDLYIHSDNVIVNRDSALNLDAGDHIGLGPMQLRMNSELSLDADTCTLGGPTDCAEGSTIYATMDVSQQGAMVGTFDLFGSMTNEGQLWATDDILVTDQLTNNANVTIYRGVLYVLGSLVNNGSIFGEVDEGPGFRGSDGNTEPGDGMRVAGNYIAGENASILMPHPYWQLAVGGDLDIAINNSGNFVMNEATLLLNGHEEQEVEVMGADYGSIEDGLDPALGCTFPIGNVKVASGAHVVLVDNRDNDCEGDLAEVMYVENLIVEVGATLDTNGHVIYVADYDNQGTILGEDDVIIIDPPVYADLNGDGVVNIDDMLIVIGQWGACNGCAGDVNETGAVDIDDLLIVIANWT